MYFQQITVIYYVLNWSRASKQKTSNLPKMKGGGGGGGSMDMLGYLSPDILVSLFTYM